MPLSKYRGLNIFRTWSTWFEERQPVVLSVLQSKVPGSNLHRFGSSMMPSRAPSMLSH